jgi:hypothetical protein
MVTVVTVVLKNPDKTRKVLRCLFLKLFALLDRLNYNRHHRHHRHRSATKRIDKGVMAVTVVVTVSVDGDG